MKFRGGYNVLLQGRPGHSVNIMPEPKVLYLPLRTKRFSFSDICIEDGQQVNMGDTLATDPGNYSIPLLAPRTGKARLNAVEGHIVLEEITKYDKQPKTSQAELTHIEHEAGASAVNRDKMVSLGSWEFVSDAYDGKVPDPTGTPQAIIVSTISLEPFVARGDIQLQNRLLKFTRGLEHLQSFLEYQPIYLVMPKVKSTFSSRVKEQVRGHAWVKIIEVPLKYPNDNFGILARGLGLKSADGPIWCLKTEGVLAADRALTISHPSLVRIVSVGGPETKTPVHIKAMTGYPINSIVEKYAAGENVRVIDGGMLTGKTADAQGLGINSECRGLTLMTEHTEREFLGFVRPGFDRKSYAPCFLSSLRVKFEERLTTAIFGEERPCVDCNFCEEVCPAGIMPHLLHKYLYSDLIEEAIDGRVDLCVQCGLCSYVCPSKIELREQFALALDQIEREIEEARLDAIKQEKRRLAEEARREKAEQEAQENA